jgi:hypothetical protein
MSHFHKHRLITHLHATLVGTSHAFYESFVDCTFWRFDAVLMIGSGYLSATTELPICGLRMLTSQRKGCSEGELF